MVAIADRFKVIPAVYLVFRNKDEVLLLKRANTSYRDGDYSLPAGHVDGGEPAVQAAVREAKEEVDVNIDSADLRLIHTMHRSSIDPEPHERIDLFFAVEKWHGTLRNAEENKCSEIRWCSLQALPANMVPEVRFVLEKIAAHETYSDFNF